MTATMPLPDAVAAAPSRRSPGRRARADAVARTAAGAGLWLSLLLVALWWVRGGGVQALAGWESGLTSLGRLSGLVASDLLLAQVLLIARIPVLERAFGQDTLLRHHRIVGFTSFNLMLTHIGLITWGYAAGDLTATPGTFWNLTTTYPGMLLALAGSACLVMVAVTSVRAARRRLRYESWHLLHLYAYLGAGLAVPHQLWSGQDFRASAASTVFWWTFWALAAGAVLVWRVAVPLVRSARHRLRVTSVIAESNDVVSVYVTGRWLERLPVESGQFFAWRFLRRTGWTRGNPYSLSAAPDGRSLRISVKDLGDNSRTLRDLRPGTPVLVEGPYGRLSARPDPAADRADRRRRRGHPTAGAGGGARLRTGRRGAAATVHRRTAVRARVPGPRGRARARAGLAARPPARAGLVARSRRRPRRRPDAAAHLGAGHRRPRRLRVRPRALDRRGTTVRARRQRTRRAHPRREVRMVNP